ncbi:vanadium-dependent haloperoxidase [Ferruginibacter sp. SUN106]|uniref:vanadium-dependent haloperoxidase n=1 Tax=Ferruginibacter sp. SUN106 TaxID=2978348 RepID=UPI003D36DB73
MKSLLTICIACSIAIIACNKNKDTADKTENTSANMVLQWNNAGMEAMRRTGSLPPMLESRITATLNVTIHDVLNNIIPKYETYALNNAVVSGANADAAVAQAAHDVLLYLLPPQKTFADSLLDVSLNSIAAGTDKDQGIALGKSAATVMITMRTNDGSTTAQYPYTQGTLPGQYRSTPPFDAGPNAGFVLLPGWGKVKLFGLASAAQFRVGAPYLTSSAAYAADYNEIKKMGCTSCPDRSADQTQIGMFWLENVPASLNRIAAAFIKQNNLSAWKAARLLALLHMAEADANISCFDAKFFYNFWRPVTAVRAGDTDSNTVTIGDPAWNLLAAPTPPVPDYPSNHATDGGAGMTIIKNFFGKDDISFSTTSASLPGITRSFTSLTQATREISLSRIYVGYHFRMAVDSGEAMGRKIGQYIFDHSLREK